MHFNDCKLSEVDFSSTSLVGAIFNDCDLSGSIFNNSVIEQADFRTAYNYSIDPENNRIEKAKFSVQGIIGLLDKYNIIIEQ